MIVFFFLPMSPFAVAKICADCAPFPTFLNLPCRSAVMESHAYTSEICHSVLRWVICKHSSLSPLLHSVSHTLWKPLMANTLFWSNNWKNPHTIQLYYAWIHFCSLHYYQQYFNILEMSLYVYPFFLTDSLSKAEMVGWRLPKPMTA